MPTITISNAAMNCIQKAAVGVLTEGVRTGPDEWRVPLEDDTLDRIRSRALKGESISDTIVRVFALAGGKLQ